MTTIQSGILHDAPALARYLTFPLDDPKLATAALWLWLRGELLHRGREIEKALSPAFGLDRVIDAFRYARGRDLSGNEDGTESPAREAAIAAAIVQGQGTGLDGGSFVAVQQWRVLSPMGSAS